MSSMGWCVGLCARTLACLPPSTFFACRARAAYSDMRMTASANANRARAAYSDMHMTSCTNACRHARAGAQLQRHFRAYARVRNGTEMFPSDLGTLFAANAQAIIGIVQARRGGARAARRGWGDAVALGAARCARARVDMHSRMRARRYAFPYARACRYPFPYARASICIPVCARASICIPVYANVDIHSRKLSHVHTRMRAQEAVSITGELARLHEAQRAFSSKYEVGRCRGRNG